MSDGASEARDRERLEHLRRYITRPAPSDERVQFDAAGHVVLKPQTAWRDGTAHLVMSPLEFIPRLLVIEAATQPAASWAMRDVQARATALRRPVQTHECR
jgi:hypothetical protein